MHLFYSMYKAMLHTIKLIEIEVVQKIIDYFTLEKKLIDEQIDKYNKLLESITKAKHFILNANDDIEKDKTNPQSWF